MSTDKQQEQRVWLIVRCIIALCIGAFILGLLGVIAEPCNSDKVTLNCRVRPFTLFDGIGIVGFIGAAYFMVSGGRPFVKRDLFNEAGSGKWAGIIFAVLVVSTLLFWFL